MTKKNKTIAFAKIEDSSGRGEVVFWSNARNKCKDIIKEDAIVVCIGKAESDGNGIKLIADSSMTMFDAMTKFSKGVSLWIERDDDNSALLDTFTSLCSVPGVASDVIFNVYDKSANNHQSYHANVTGFQVNESSINKLIDVFGQNNVKLLTLI